MSEMRDLRSRRGNAPIIYLRTSWSDIDRRGASGGARLNLPRSRCRGRLFGVVLVFRDVYGPCLPLRSMFGALRRFDPRASDRATSRLARALARAGRRSRMRARIHTPSASATFRLPLIDDRRWTEEAFGRTYSTSIRSVKLLPWTHRQTKRWLPRSTTRAQSPLRCRLRSRCKRPRRRSKP